MIDERLVEAEERLREAARAAAAYRHLLSTVLQVTGTVCITLEDKLAATACGDEFEVQPTDGRPPMWLIGPKRLILDPRGAVLPPPPVAGKT